MSSNDQTADFQSCIDAGCARNWDDHTPEGKERCRAYAVYEASTDPTTEAELIDQEAEGQPVGDMWRERQHELRGRRAEMGLGDQVAELEVER